MAKEIVMPALGETVQEATIVRWVKNEGDPVKRGEVICEIETDKATLEVESFETGTLLKIVAPAGATASVSQVIAYVGEPGEMVAGEEIHSGTVVTQKEPLVESPGPASVQTERRGLVEHAASQSAISPRAERLARELGVDPTKVQGSGPGGRVVEKDVRAYTEGSAPVRPQEAQPREATVEPLSKMRRVIAERMARSIATIPQYHVTVRVDMSEVARRRARAKAAGTADVSITDFIVKACASALREFPMVNATCLGSTVRFNAEVNIGLAVDLDDGLVVPVIRGADRKTLAEIAAARRDLVDRAKSRHLLPDEYAGDTFTISNLGAFDVDTFAAIIQPDQAAVLAVGAVKESAVVASGKVEVRPTAALTLTADHRLIDGAVAARFLQAVRHWLETVPES